jgi:DNA-binding transcriptional ArsR family regulator
VLVGALAVYRKGHPPAAQVLAKEKHSMFAQALRAGLDVRKDRIKDLHSEAGLRRLSDLLDHPASRSTASHALRRLQDANVVTRLERGRYRIEDEAYAEWIRQRTSSRVRDSLVGKAAAKPKR